MIKGNMDGRKLPVKGFREGLLISLGEGDWHEVAEQLIAQIDERADFFKGARLAVDVHERQVRAAEMGELRDKLSEREITLFAILGKSAITQAIAESLGLATTKSVLKQKREGFSQAVFNGEKAILFQKTMRSGMSINYPGHVVVEGDVNPGAEVVATGSIYIWGKLRGSVYAGAEGSKDEVVCALDFNPIRLRIADVEKDEPKIKVIRKKIICKAKVQDGVIKLVEWSPSK